MASPTSVESIRSGSSGPQNPSAWRSNAFSRGSYAIRARSRLLFDESVAFNEPIYLLRGAWGVEAGDQPAPAGLVLDLRRQGARVHDEPVDLHHPGQRVLFEQRATGQVGLEDAKAERLVDQRGLVGHRRLDDTRVAGELIGAEVGLLGAVEQEVHPSDRVDRSGRPDARIATHKRRGALARQPRDEHTTELTVLIVEMCGADCVGDREDLRDPRAQPGGNLELRERTVCGLRHVQMMTPTTDAESAVRRAAPVSGLTNAKAIAGYLDSNLALLADGTVVSWGENVLGELGDGTTVASFVPVAVSGLGDVRVIARGEDSLALLADGTVMAWGSNISGQLGIGTLTGPTECFLYNVCSPTPVPVSELKGARAIAAGSQHNLALLSDGEVMAWGENWDGQLGTGNTASTDTPAPVPGLIDVSEIAAGEDRSFAYGMLGEPMPEVSGLSPVSGSQIGGTAVTVTGKNLAGATAVMFGTQNAASYTVNSDEAITALSPPGTGMVGVTVKTRYGTSASEPADSFTYAPLAQVSSARQRLGPLVRLISARLPMMRGEIFGGPRGCRPASLRKHRQLSERRTAMRRAGRGSARGCRARRAAACCVLGSARASAGQGRPAGACARSRQQRLQDLSHHRAYPQLARERKQLSRLGVSLPEVGSQRGQRYVPSGARAEAQEIDDRALLGADGD